MTLDQAERAPPGLLQRGGTALSSASSCLLDALDKPAIEPRTPINVVVMLTPLRRQVVLYDWPRARNPLHSNRFAQPYDNFG
jgi:hypothetical protein